MDPKLIWSYSIFFLFTSLWFLLQGHWGLWLSTKAVSTTLRVVHLLLPRVPFHWMATIGEWCNRMLTIFSKSLLLHDFIYFQSLCLFFPGLFYIQWAFLIRGPGNCISIPWPQPQGYWIPLITKFVAGGPQRTSRFQYVLATSSCNSRCVEAIYRLTALQNTFRMQPKDTLVSSGRSSEVLQL